MKSLINIDYLTLLALSRLLSVFICVNLWLILTFISNEDGSLFMKLLDLSCRAFYQPSKLLLNLFRKFAGRKSY